MLEAVNPSRIVLFAVGGGGDPERHLPLLTSLAEHGSTVVAPHFERLSSPYPTDHDLLLRGRRLNLALDSVADPDLPVAGVGHSIGTTLLLALAGAQAWTRSGQRLSIAPEQRLARLALLAPATLFFQAPGALDALSVPILAWAGTNDSVTPLTQAEFLTSALGGRVPVEVRVVEGAGHFSFMDTPPPGMAEPLLNRDAFLGRLRTEVCRFVTE